MQARKCEVLTYLGKITKDLYLAMRLSRILCFNWKTQNNDHMEYTDKLE